MFRSERLITKSHHIAAVECGCLTWNVVATLNTSFSHAQMNFEQGQVAVIDTNHNYIFWSEYDTGGIGGNERGVVVTVDVTVPSLAFITDTLPLDLGRLSNLCGIDDSSGSIFFLNLSDTVTLNNLNIASDRNHPSLVSSTNCSPTIGTAGADGMTIVGSPDYYVAADQGLQIFDISGVPTSVAVLTDTGIHIRGIGYRASDKILFANAFHDWGDGNFGAIISYDLSVIGAPVELDRVETIQFGFARAGISVYGNYLYAITEDIGTNNVISIFDISDPSNILFVDYVYTSPSHTTVAATMIDIIAAGTCLWALFPAGWQSFDLTVPTNPLACTTGSFGLSSVEGWQIGGLQMVVGTESAPNKIVILTP